MVPFGNLQSFVCLSFLETVVAVPCLQPLFYEEHAMRTGPLQRNVLDDSGTEAFVESTFHSTFPFEAAVEKMRRQFEVRTNVEALATDAALYVQPRASPRYVAVRVPCALNVPL